MHDLVKKTSLHYAYFLSLHNKNKKVMERKSGHKLPFYNNNNNNKDFIYRGYRYIQQRTKSIKIKNIHACMYQPTEHSSSAVGPSYINIKKHTLIYIYLNNIMISR